MNASYLARLLLQCLNSFFAAYLLFSIAVHFLTPVAVCYAERVRPAIGTRLLLSLRLLPLGAALYAVAAIALPSYLRLEGEMGPERIGVRALGLAVLALACWIRPLVRSVCAVSKSSKFLKYARRVARRYQTAPDIGILTGRQPHIAVAGLFRPQVFVSEAAVKLFAPDELNVILRHESAHQKSRDNLKRLLLLALPDALPCVNFTRPLERAWKRLVEWSADDHAAGGDSESSILLARALVSFARHQPHESKCVLATSFVDDTSDLERRVERLLGHARPMQPSPRAYFASSMLASAILGAALQFADLDNAHRLLELLSR